MANPQLENGYVKIANEMVKELCRINLNKGESKILWTVISKTYGWNKKIDDISLTQFSLVTGMTRTGVCKAIKTLVKRNILGSKQNGTSKTTTYWFQKDYIKWITSNQKDTSKQKDTKGSKQKGNQVVNKKIHTKDNIKTIKDNILSQVENLLKTFDSNFQNKIKIYLDRVSKQNKSGVITEGRKLTLLNELFNAKERCNNDTDFAYAMDQCISRDICNIGYLNAILKNKKTKKPTESRAAYHAYV